MSEKVYVGRRTAEGCVVGVRRGRHMRPLPPRNDVWNHSPTGFEWGYGGSGPAQLALAILCDATGDVVVAAILHQAYTSAVVACLPAAGWEIPWSEVADWIAGPGLVHASEIGEAITSAILDRGGNHG